MKPLRTLYVCYFGLREPLVQTQVLPYLRELAASGVAYFKLDGVFGNLKMRNFDIEGFKGGEVELNDAKHDEAKERYLSLGSERLMKIFKRMGVLPITSPLASMRAPGSEASMVTS